MGMFDTIRKVEYPLPHPEYQDNNFQTKDLGNSMEEYTITADGRLIHHYVEWDLIPEEEREEGKWWPIMRPVEGSQREVDTHYHGDLRFYDCLGQNCAGWIEYRARFTEGRITKLETIEHRSPGGEDGEPG